MGGTATIQNVHADGDIVAVAGDFIAAPTPSIASLHQIPPPPQNFTGRATELEELITAHDGDNVKMFGLHGMGGIGKTALVRKLAEHISPNYPDAQLNLNLKGNTPLALSVADAMVQIIRSFHPTGELPTDEAALAGLYQSVLYGKKGLLLLEDAISEEQIEALIPPRSCTVIATSRQVIAVAGMLSKNLGTLLPEDARSLLLSIAQRINDTAEPIADLCGNLPFALRLAAGAIATQADLSPSEYVRRLGDARKQLELIEASLSISYELLTPEVKSLWCALSVFPETFNVDAAAAVWKIEHDPAKEVISTLVRHNLVEWNPSTERYRLHNLVRVFASHHLSEADRDKCDRRFFNHYLEVFFKGDQLYRAGGDATKRGLDLYDLERANIEAGQLWIVAHAEDDDTAAEVCAHYPLHGGHLLRLRVHPSKRIELYEVALSAARRIADRGAEGAHIYNLGLAYLELGNSSNAIKFSRQYLKFSRELKDRAREAAALTALGQAYESIGQYRRSIILYHHALKITHEVGDRTYVSTELLYLGQVYQRVGMSDQANGYYLQAYNIARELGIRQNEGSALACLAGLHLHHGCDDAFRYSEQALSIFQEIGYKSGEAGVLDTLGQLHTNTGNPRRGIELQEQALDMARQLSDPIGENKALGNIGLSYAALRDYSSAVSFYQQQLDIARRINDQQSVGNALMNMAKAYIVLDEPNRAIELCSQAMNIYRTIGSRKEECGGYAIYGEAYHALGEDDRAANFYMQRAKFARGIGHHGCEASAYFEMGKIFYGMGARAEGIICAQCSLMIHEKYDPSESDDVRKQLAIWLGDPSVSDVAKP